MRDYPSLTEDTFWIQVDELIDEYRKDCKSPQELDEYVLIPSVHIYARLIVHQVIQSNLPEGHHNPQI